MLNDVMLTTKEVAKRLGINHDTLRHWRSKGKGPRYLKVDPNSQQSTVRYPEKYVEQWIKEKGVPAIEEGSEKRAEKMTTKREKRTLLHQRTVERIKRLRSIEKQSQVQIAERLNWKPASYSDIESFNKKLDLDKLSEIAKFFNVTIGFLTEGHKKEGISKERLEQIENSIEFMNL